MLSFILNNETIETGLPPGMTVLDFVRYHKHLTGTKIGCREGDCGACTVLVGTLTEGTVRYRSMTSCLMPIANAQGKHLVTVEGINPPETAAETPVQQALVNENASQCGYCTVGFVMSLTGFCLENKPVTPEKALSAIGGNICRCTGYKSIERAAIHLSHLLNEHQSQATLDFAIQSGIVPPYFSTVLARLTELKNNLPSYTKISGAEASAHAAAGIRKNLGGGTDLYVQRPEEMLHHEARNLFDQTDLQGVRLLGNQVEIGGSTTVSDLMESALLQELFPNLSKHLKLISSTPIRNMATLAGNLVNASPIGDLSIFFLAMGARVVLQSDRSREIPLRDFYLAYKTLAKTTDEVLVAVRFPKPSEFCYFNFEKVSKRTHLDIASVNSAILLSMENDTIQEARLSAGGVSPIPLYLKKTSAFLAGKKRPLSDQQLLAANEVLQSEIRPVSDMRGSEVYKRLLMRQLLQAHLIETGIYR